MVIKFLTRTTLHRLTLNSKQTPTFPKIRQSLFSTKPKSHRSNYRIEISLASLLRRYGFSPSQVQYFLKRNNVLLKSTSLNDIEKSLCILLSFKIPQKSIVSLVCECPGVLEFEFLKKWEMGVSNLGDLVVSPLVMRSVLECSRRFQMDPDGFFRILEVLKGLGFTEGIVSKVLEEFPRVILMEESDICRRIHFLVAVGIPREGIDRVLYSFPGILGLGIENRLKPLLDDFRELGFSQNMVRKEILREPRILGMELGELARCLELLGTLKCREPIKEKIFSEGAFRAGVEVKLRVDCLCRHGLIRREAFKVLWKEPRVIIYDTADMEEKIEFLVNRMGFNVGCLVEVPEYLGVNFDKQIVPRYKVIEYLRSIGGLDSEVTLRDIIKLSRLRFYNLYVKPYPVCEKMFGRFSDNEVRRHPVGLWKLFTPQKHEDTKEDVKTMKAFMESLESLNSLESLD
ncbi:mTERF domain-containing protein [Cephalotus follicularis]|uniref:mTERF domain-containing protein n=1 Tax=Cephalotus follicularis TaxID=3775 RepID=A0A1Q3BA01_CEPFO|nr:mTERF domain-containing protein [Cephalotus follicularis]